MSFVLFGPFDFDTETLELRRRGRALRLRPQAGRVLALLVSRPAQLVSRDEIREHIWGEDVHVDFDQGLNACVRQIRAVLADDAEVPRYVETLPRRGYRFIAPLTTPEESPELMEDAAAPAPEPERRRPRATLVAVAVLSAAAALIAALRFERPQPESAPSGPSSAASSQSERLLLAVFPFDDLSTVAEEASFSLGLTDEVITRTSQLEAERLGVLARSSAQQYRQAGRSISEMASELGVDYVLEGSVRRDASALRLIVQLIRANDQSILWSDAFEETGAPSLAWQKEVAGQVSAGVAAKLLPAVDRADAVVAGTSVARRDPAARDAYLRGYYHLENYRLADLKGAPDPSKLGQAVAAFERAVELEPTMAEAWVALGRAVYIRRDQPLADNARRARAAAQRALELDAGQVKAHLLMTGIHLFRNLDWPAARRSLERAVELNPGLAETQHVRALYLSTVARHDEAIAAAERSLELDPWSQAVRGDVGAFYFRARRYDEAVLHLRRALDLAPSFDWARRELLLVHMARGAVGEAAALARESLVNYQAPAELLDAADAGGPEEVLEVFWRFYLELLFAYGQTNPLPSSELAFAYAALGEKEKAVDALVAGYEEGTGGSLAAIAVHPTFDVLRGEPRFQELVRRIGPPIS